ncbi:MAG: translation initiation factor IF-2 associated domain-containing protein, partial [Gammaproteobacteria bacterium]|nr:translation initiation factor IF-2 associated domain-containing protein [Gammaproteobacteria bacterium]
MSGVTVKQFAETVGTPVERLIEQLKEAGVDASGADTVLSEDDKLKLLNLLRSKRGTEDEASEPKRITLKRKTTSALAQSGAKTGSKSVTVEVRKKRTYVKRSTIEDEQKAEEPPVEELNEIVAPVEEEVVVHNEAVIEAVAVEPSLAEDAVAEISEAVEAAPVVAPKPKPAPVAEAVKKPADKFAGKEDASKRKDSKDDRRGGGGGKRDKLSTSAGNNDRTARRGKKKRRDTRVVESSGTHGF